MAGNEGLFQVQLEASGCPRLMQKIAFTGTGAVTALAATTIDSTAQATGVGITNPQLMLWADQDCWVEFVPSAQATAVTALAGARPGIWLAQNTFWLLYITKADTGIDVIRNTANGTLVVYLVRS